MKIVGSDDSEGFYVRSRADPTRSLFYWMIFLLAEFIWKRECPPDKSERGIGYGVSWRCSSDIIFDDYAWCEMEF